MLTFASLRKMETRNCLYYFCNFMSEIQNLKIFLRHISDQVGWENITYVTGSSETLLGRRGQWNKSVKVLKGEKYSNLEF